MGRSKVRPFPVQDIVSPHHGFRIRGDTRGVLPRIPWPWSGPAGLPNGFCFRGELKTPVIVLICCIATSIFKETVFVAISVSVIFLKQRLLDIEHK